MIENCEGALLALLEDAGVAPGPVSGDQIRVLVHVMERFARIPVDDAAPVEVDGDGVLAQYGTHTFRDVPEFEADLTRQLRDVADRDPQTWQLSCTLRWDATEDTDALGAGSLWSFGMPLDAFFVKASSLSGWAWATRTDRPANLDVAFGPV